MVEATARPAGIVGWLDHVGSLVLRGLDDLGRFFYIMASSVTWTFRRPFDGAELLRQMVRVGWDSIPVVFLTCLFTGMVLALQTYRGFERFHAEGFVGSVVALSLTRELGPVLTALLFAGRAGSALTAEIGLMKATDQLAAMEMMAVDPVQRVIAPRFLAGFLSMPLLAALFTAVGVWGGNLVGVGLLGVDSGVYWSAMQDGVDVYDDVLNGVIKSLVFGFMVTWIAVFEGYDAVPTSEGVSRATTRTVVNASLAVLALDFILTSLMFE